MTIPEWPNYKRSLDAYDLAGKRALVLGAASGAGRAIALALAEAGADLALSTVTTKGDETVAGGDGEQGDDREADGQHPSHHAQQSQPPVCRQRASQRLHVWPLV